MVHQWISAYRSKTFEQKIEIATIFSLCLNLILAVGKIVITIISHSFVFLVSAGINACICLAKLECYRGIKQNISGKEFKKKNGIIALLLMLSGLMYVIYMGRLLLMNVQTYRYDMYIGIIIAFISFMEMGFSIVGIIRVKKCGHFYRNIKIINFASACIAIVLTQMAILSFSNQENMNKVNGLVGVVIGVFTILLGVVVLILPSASMVDRIHNEYEYTSSYAVTIKRLQQYEGKYKVFLSNDSLEIVFSNHFVYGKYSYKAHLSVNGIQGDLVHERNFFRLLPIYAKILMIVLSEILIFVWLIGRGIDFCKNAYLPQKLDRLMTTFHLKYKITPNEETIDDER